jgi:predicted DNA-binding transcriptional regulator YafY
MFLRQDVDVRADRLLRVIVLLQRHGRLTAARLAELLEVSERTVLRDMEALSAAGVPVYTERGRHGGCVLLGDFRTDVSGLTATEAQALFAWSGRERIEELGLRADLTGALAKVAASADAGLVADAEAMGQVLVSDRRRWFADAERTPELPRLREAVTGDRRVRIRYGARGRRSPEWRTVDPWGLVDHSGRWYLVGAHRGRARTFRVSRIEELAVTADPIKVRAGRPLAEVWADLRRAFEATAPDPVTVELQVAAEIEDTFLDIARGQVLGESITPLGRHCWRLTIRARRSALALVTAWAPDVRLLAPDDLLDDVRRAGEAVRSLYGEPDGQ